VYPFFILDLEHHTTDEQVAERYQQLLRHFPPETAPDEFSVIRNAYEAVRSRRGRVRTRIFYFDKIGQVSVQNYLPWIQKRPRKRFNPEQLSQILKR